MLISCLEVDKIMIHAFFLGINLKSLIKINGVRRVLLSRLLEVFIYFILDEEVCL